MTLSIRKETDADHERIREITESAFRPMPFSNGDEQHVIDRLRTSGKLLLSLVATVDDQIVGHIAFSPVTIESIFIDWYALGPVSVLPDYQGKGIGSTLIETGLSILREKKAQGCILTGNPFYYCKFGFEVASEYAPANEPKEYFMVNQFIGSQPPGVFAFDSAFYEQQAV